MVIIWIIHVEFSDDILIENDPNKYFYGPYMTFYVTFFEQRYYRELVVKRFSFHKLTVFMEDETIYIAFDNFDNIW